jgi:GTP-binding protein HflX
MFQVSRDLSRQVGLLVNRRGVVDAVIVGGKERIEIPALSTDRMGRARFRGVRFIHTHLTGELLSKEDLTDLALLQLDLIACITQARGEAVETIHIGYLVPENKKGQVWDFLGPLPVDELELNFTEFIAELENEFLKERGRYYATKGNAERTILVIVVPPGRHKNVEERIAEMKDLSRSAGLSVIDVAVQRPKEFDPKHLIG